MGRDLLSRIIFGGRVSLTVGLVGVFISVLLGSLLGTLSGYWGGWLDVAIQRLIELLRPFRAISLWLALAAAPPANLVGYSSLFRHHDHYSLLGLGRPGPAGARQDIGNAGSRLCAGGARGRSRALVYPDTPAHCLRLQSYYHHRDALHPRHDPRRNRAQLSRPGHSSTHDELGVLLEEAQRVTVVLHYPWLLFSALPVMIVVIAYNFVGDALRDAADPYSA